MPDTKKLPYLQSNKISVRSLEGVCYLKFPLWLDVATPDLGGNRDFWSTFSKNPW